MHFRLKVFPYKLGSVSARSLARGLGIKRVRPTYDARRKDIVINWGNSTGPYFQSSSNDLNKHTSIALACNKLKTFNKLNGQGFTHIPDYTVHKEEASSWLEAGHKVYCRTLLTSHSGNGIVIVEPGSTLVEAPLYTKDTKHKHEFRVHVFKGDVIDVQQKKRKLNAAHNGTGIRNHSNGWIYARLNLDVPDIILEASTNAVDILGLDFGAVDIGYREVDGKAFLLEVNTAPGLVGTTLSIYVNRFKQYLMEKNHEMFSM